MGQRVYEPGVEVSSMSNGVGKADRTGYHLKALQEIRNSLRPFATENGSNTVPTIHKDGNISYQHHLFQTGSSYSEVSTVVALLIHCYIEFLIIAEIFGYL